MASKYTKTIKIILRWPSFSPRKEPEKYCAIII